MQLALAVLSDEKRRERYDRTGEVGEEEPDNFEGKALNMVMKALSMALEGPKPKLNIPPSLQILWGTGPEPQLDILGSAKQIVEENLVEIQGIIDKTLNLKQRLEKESRKFRAKQGKENKISKMLRAQATQLTFGLEHAEGEKACLKKALKILSDHTYDLD